MEKIEFGAGRTALVFGEQKINLHQLGKEFEPRAENGRQGNADLCFIIDTPITQAVAQLRQQGIEIIEGPADRTGARGMIISA